MLINKICDMSCKLLRKFKDIILICPYNLKVFGLEKNPQCRLRLILLNKEQVINSLFIKNGLYLKRYDEINEYINYIKECKDIKQAIFPVEKVREVKANKSEIIKKIKNMLNMNYDNSKIYDWIFKPVVDYSDELLNKLLNNRVYMYSNDYLTSIISINENNRYYIIKNYNLHKNLDTEIERIMYKLSTLDINLSKFFSLFYDDNIQEIYLDKEEDFVYVDHDLYGRCKTNVYLGLASLEKLKALLSLLGKGEITDYNPSLKAELKTPKFHVRISIDSPPLTLWTSVDIRRLRVRYMRPTDLVRTGFASPIAMAYIIQSAMCKANIIICGEPNSGKTTLANSIDAVLPKSWRRIYVEDVIESMDLIDLGYHQVKVQVNPIEEVTSPFKKSNEIVKLLHRSPDWIYLGEIQTEDHVRSMFHAFSCGLRGIATIHSWDVESLLERWFSVYGLSRSLIKVIDLIICTRRIIDETGLIHRFIFKIYEPDLGQDYEIVKVFERVNNELKPSIDISTTPFIKKVEESGFMSSKEFLNRVEEIAASLGGIKIVERL